MGTLAKMLVKLQRHDPEIVTEYEYRWQPIPSPNATWYSLYRRSIQLDPKLRGKERLAGVIEMSNLIHVLIVGCSAQVRAKYNRQSHTLIILGPKEDKKENE